MHGGDELPGQVALGDVVGRPLAQGLDGGLLAAVRGHQDHGQSGVVAADGLDQLQAVHLGHVQIGDDDVRLLRRDHRERVAPVRRVDGNQAGALLEQAARARAVHGGVVDHQDDRHQDGFPA